MDKRIAVFLGLAIAGSTAVVAGDREHADSKAGAGIEIGVDTKLSIDEQFDRLDSNSDGVISRTEAKANTHADKAFESFDDGDGKLDKTDYAAGLKARASGKGNVNAGSSAEDGSLEGENATIGAGTDTEIRAGAEFDEAADEAKSSAAGVAAGIGARGSASDGTEKGGDLPSNLKKRFRAIDNNDDGLITRGEAKVDPIVIAAFDKHDRNSDGKLDEQEFKAAAKAGVKVKSKGGS